MGEIVAALGTCHTPYMFTRPPDEDPKQLDQAGRAMEELGRALDGAGKSATMDIARGDQRLTLTVARVPGS